MLLGSNRVVNIDAHEPVADGIRFSDASLFPRGCVNFLAKRGLVYLTEFTAPDGNKYGGDVIAHSWGEAELIADARGHGEKVIGTLSEIVRR